MKVQEQHILKKILMVFLVLALLQLEQTLP